VSTTAGKGFHRAVIHGHADTVLSHFHMSPTGPSTGFAAKVDGVMVQPLEEARRRSRPNLDRLPPHDLGAEESLLGAMLLSRDAIASAVERCGADDFYRPAHGHIFDAICSLYAQGEPADPITVADELRRADLLEMAGGVGALIALQANTPAITNAGRYAKIVEEHALLRRLIGVAGEIAEMGYQLPEDVTAALDRAESMVFEVAERRVTDSLRPLRDLLHDSLDHLEALYGRGDAITGVPTGYIDIDERLSGLQPNALIIVGARPAMGKCVLASTRLVDPDTGLRHRIDDLVARARRGQVQRVLSLDAEEGLVAVHPSAFVDDGIKPVVRVRTRSGRQVTTTWTHPFLTPEGWRPLMDLAPGVPIAVPGALPVEGRTRLPDAEVALLGYLCGAPIAWRRPFLVAGDLEVAADLRGHAHAVGLRLESGVGDGSLTFWPVASGEEPITPPAALVDILRRHGVWGTRQVDRRVPPAVFGLEPDLVALFLNRLFASCGSAWWSGDDGRDRITLESPSRELLADTAHLLLRFGVHASIAARPRRSGPGFELVIAGPDDLARFCARVGIVGQDTACRRLAALTRQPLGCSEDSSRGVHLAGRSRATPPRRAAVADLPPAPTLRWDPIVTITPVGEEQVYDLTVPVTHNFVADDVLVHNTAFALGIAANAAMEKQVPVLLFSLEMSHLEITQRLLCAEARVDSGRMRNGKLHEADWPKIVNAVGRLGEAPLYIDDNPNLTVMEIRAKARRLKSRGGLGLIIIDYLQLMSGRSNAENRQVEISEISRGLKILARELQVPVVALSQLSRNLEARADKRPMLADLRESGSLEQDADVVMFIYRDEVYNPESSDRGTAEIIVAKHRNGPTGVAQLAFLDHVTRFANMARV
jgi:replicative DNA helicase